MGDSQGYYWERARRGAAPLVIGAVGLAGLGVAQLLPVRHRVESDLHDRSQAALTQAGLAGVEADFTGQDGVLRGTVASAADVDKALAVVGRLEGVRAARSELSYPGSALATPAPTGTPSASATASPSGSPTGSATASPTPSATESPTLTATESPTMSATTSPTPSATGSPSPSVTASVAVPPTGSATVPPTASATAPPTGTPSAAPAPTASGEVTVTATPAVTPPPTATPKPTPAASASPAVTPAPAVTAPPPVTAAPGAAAVRRELAALPRIGFAYESTALSPSARRTVARAAAILRSAPDVRVRVTGFTDDRGDWDVNLAVSTARAEAVRAALIADGVPAARLTTTGFSEERPKASNSSAYGRALNRRVELSVR